MNKHLRLIFAIITAAALIILFSACQGEKPSPSSGPAPTATPVLTGVLTTQVVQPIGASTEQPIPTHAAPLKIEFPNQDDQPQSIWRPPLYQVPFALSPFDHFYFSRPIAVDKVNWPLADYKYGDFFPDRPNIIHTGVDIDAPAGTPVLAAAPGQVMWAGYGYASGTEDPNDPYGDAVSIRHDFGWNGRKLTTVYAHMSRVDVVSGQFVQAGQQIGIVGSTGATTGPHLHFEVRLEDTSKYFSTRNPELWLAPPEGWGLLVGRVLKNDGAVLIGQVVTARSLSTNKTYSSRTYAPLLTVPDDYYKENVVIADLPAGFYEVTIDYDKNRYSTIIQVHPGSVSFFIFQGDKAFRFDPPQVFSPSAWLGN
jgi:murein DD-endopeptidase MepM/ murein hydrolase activator NlpD